MNSIRRLALIGILVVLVITAFGLAQQPEAPAQANSIFPLQAPVFISVARAAEEESITSVIEDEAGISAYFEAATPINMTNVRDAFRTIENEDEDCIVGSVEVLNYPESEDVHVIVCSDGWVVAYYLAADPVAKVFDWRAYHDSVQTVLTTKLENTLAKVAIYGQVAYADCTYYDFRYPNATDLMLIADWVRDGSDSFEVSLPVAFTVEERSWSLGNNSAAYIHASYTLDGVTIASHSGGWKTSQGFLSYAQLLPDQFHTITVYAKSSNVSGCYGYGGLALVYQVP